MEYRLASTADKQRIIDFMDTYWGSKHPILHRQEYFDYYFCTGKAINFAVAEDDGKILAVCGFLPCNESGEDIWISLWQAAPKKNGVGLELMSRMLALTGAKRMSCNNIREETQVFYQFLGYHTGEIAQYYRLAPREVYTVAKPADPARLPVDSAVQYVRIPDLETLVQKADFPMGGNPHKDLWHLRRRYFDFPGYGYQLYGLKRDGKIKAMFALRVNPVGQTNVLRLVDYLGSDDDFALVGGTIDALLQQYGAEYVDCYCVGMPAKVMAKAGFSLRERGSDTVIPNYLNPPTDFNTDYFYFTTDAESFRMFKADGDQDRPNLG